MAQLIWQIRRLFQKLTSESNEFLTIYGITASQRAVLEFLDHKDPETLANMARAHDVSRQHIQQIVNDLLEKQLVTTIENPAHKRSFLVQRTDKGNQLFADIKKTENALFAGIVKNFDSFYLRPFKFDATVRMGYGIINLFATYSWYCSLAALRFYSA